MRAHIWKRLPEYIVMTQLDTTRRCGHTTRIPRERGLSRDECLYALLLMLIAVLIVLTLCAMLVGWMPGWVR